MINAVLGHFMTVKERDCHAVAVTEGQKNIKMAIKATVIHLLIS